MYSEIMTSEEEEMWKADVKAHSILSYVVRSITEEYADKFLFTEKFTSSMENNTITLIGDFNIWQTELYLKDIEYEGEKKTYKIILRKI